MKLKVMAALLLSAALGSTVQAAESGNSDPYLRLKVLGNEGFVLKGLRVADTKIVSGGEYDCLVVGPSVVVDDNIKKEINNALDQGKRVLFDNQLGQQVATENAAKALGMSVEADALMVHRPKDATGLLMTPVDRPRQSDALSESKVASNKKQETENTIENVFGI